jgi:hypothetical protein
MNHTKQILHAAVPQDYSSLATYYCVAWVAYLTISHNKPVAVLNIVHPKPGKGGSNADAPIMKVYCLLGIWHI